MKEFGPTQLNSSTLFDFKLVFNYRHVDISGMFHRTLFEGLVVSYQQWHPG